MLTLLEPTPIFHRPDLWNVFGEGGILFDEKKLVRPLEYIAFPGTGIEVVARPSEHIIQVWTDNYPRTKPLYMDDRFAWQKEALPRKERPSKEKVLEKLWNFPQVIYVWGGNHAAGIDKMTTLYPPPQITPFEMLHWQCKGVDCSGLYYEVLEGTVPRNTLDLASYGQEIPFTSLEPLDILIWPGHMVIVLDSGKVIESRHADGGIIRRDLQERLEIIDHKFSCRRIF